MSNDYNLFVHMLEILNGEHLACCSEETFFAICIGFALFAISTICAPFLGSQKGSH